MDWRERCKDKMLSPQEAISHVKSGDRIIVGDWLGEPPALMRALVERGPELRNVEIVHGLSPGPNAHLAPELGESFRHNSLFLGPKARPAFNEGRLDYTSCFFFQWPRMFAPGGTLEPDVALVELSVPDENGNCSFGVSCCYTEPATRYAKTVIAQINSQMPRVGGTQIHVDKIDYIVEYDEPIYEIPKPQVGPVEEAIGGYIAELVPDEATIQLGFGSMPDAVSQCLKNKKNLGIHTETLTEGVMDLILSGVITNRKKTIHNGKAVAGNIAGSRKFYDFINNNSMIEVHPIDHTNDPRIIGQNHLMTSINACVEIDLLGQVNSEMVGLRQYSGIGGQVDFIRGAQFSPGGKSILALPSTAKKGTISKIVPVLPAGTVVTASRYDVQYVVTEYGIANLWGKTNKQRALELISIASPDFRAELRKQAKAMNLI
jgi:4-hydroxybutyrate CoA-transferase